MTGETPAQYHQFVVELRELLEDRGWHNITEIEGLDTAASREIIQYRLDDLTDYGMIRLTRSPPGGATRWVKITLIGTQWPTPAGWEDPDAPWNCFYDI